MRHRNVQSPPRTIMEAYKSLPEGTLAELIDGILYMSPAPSLQHQDVLGELSMLIRMHVKKNQLGKVYFCPCDVYLDDISNAVQPDLLFIAADNRNVSFLANGVHGAPDFVIEILSPGNANHDWKTKMSLYERFRVKEYWIVDPHSKETTGFLLKDGIYQPLENGFGQLHSSILGQSFSF
jgi:Uma2 family endonuclease